MKQRKNMRNEAKKEKDDIANHENFPQDKNQKIPIFVAEQREIRGTEIDTRLKSQATDHHQTLSKSWSNPHNSQTQIANPKPRQTSSVQRPSSKPAIKNPILPSRPPESTDPDKQIAAQTPITHTDRYKTQISNTSNPKNQARHDHRSPSP